MTTANENSPGKPEGVITSPPATGSAKTYPYNPSHPIGTCAKCGEEMIYNVPRMGPDGGFVHKATGQPMCSVKHWTQRQVRLQCHVCGMMVMASDNKQNPGKRIIRLHNGREGNLCSGSRRLVSPNEKS